MRQQGQAVGRNVIGGLVVMIVMLLISVLLVTEVWSAIKINENVGGALDDPDNRNENLKMIVGDKIGTIYTLLAVLLIVIIAGVMLRSLGVF